MIEWQYYLTSPFLVYTLKKILKQSLMSRFSVRARFASKILLYITMSFSCLMWPAGALAETLSKPPKIGLALSGGGARGAAHIGVLRELEKQNIHIDYIAGTSMGSIIAGLYASGMNADQIDKAYNSIDWDTVLNDSTPRRELSMRRKFDQEIFQLDKKIGVKDGKIELPAGVIRGQKLELELQKLLMHVAEVVDFDQLAHSIPCHSIGYCQQQGGCYKTRQPVPGPAGQHGGTGCFYAGNY